MSHSTRVAKAIVVRKTLVELTRLFSPTANIGEMAMTLSAVAIGHAEGRPMTAHKIAQYLALPRSTVINRLNNLERLGAVKRSGTRYWVALECVEVMRDKMDEAVRLLIAAGNRLSKLDNPAVTDGTMQPKVSKIDT